jgi:hypothetical protein
VDAGGAVSVNIVQVNPAQRLCSFSTTAWIVDEAAGSIKEGSW